MAEVVLTTLKCPNCGANIRAEDLKKPVECLYCGSTVIPTRNQFSNAGAYTPVNTTRVDGIKNSSSALAYIETFFDSFDWDAFAYSDDISILEIDMLVESLMVTSADEKNTWILSFLSTYTPYMKKARSCEHVLDDVVAGYMKGNLDTYSKFDAYKQIVAMLEDTRPSVVKALENAVVNAEKYGASNAEIYDLKTKLDGVKFLNVSVAFETVESIPQIQEYIRQKNERIKSELLADGIDADAEYERALAAIEENKYTDALDILMILHGYRDSGKLIEKVDKLFVISDVLEIAGSLYYLQKARDGESYDLYKVKDRVVSSSPILNKIARIVTNYANRLYYIDTSNRLRCFDLMTCLVNKVYKNEFDPKSVFLKRDGYLYIVARVQNASSDTSSVEFATIKLSNGEIKIVLSNIEKVCQVFDKKIVYVVSEKKGVRITKICDYNGENVMTVGRGVIVEGVVDDSVIYTKPSPNKFNKDIYVISKENEPRLIEKNIYKFDGVYAGKLFYYVGCEYRSSLINVNLDGTQRREMPSCVSKILCNIGEHIYFIRTSGHNSVICKSRIDGSGMCVVADDVEDYIALKNGYMYYLDYYAHLIRVRMDGSGRKDLCKSVKKVLFVDDNKIVFLSTDGKMRGQGEEPDRVVSSIYQIDLLGEGIRKLAYDVKEAKQYDDNFVYYIAEKPATGDTRLDMLFRLDLQTGDIVKLMEIRVSTKKSNMGCLASIIAAVLLLIITFIGISNESMGLLIFGGLGVLIAGVAGICSMLKGTE